MCARWPTIAMSKIFFGFERSFCRCMAVLSCEDQWCVCDLTSFHQVMWLVVRWFVVLLRSYSVLQRPTTYYSNVFTRIYTCKPDMSLPLLRRQAGGSHRCSWKNYKVLQRTTPVLLCTTKYYSGTTLYYKVLLCTTPVLLCTTQYYNVLLCTTKYHASSTPVLLSTTKYYNVLLQYYSVLQSATPVLLCTTKYYASTTLYYKVLQRTTPVLLCTTKYYSGTTLYYKVLLCTRPVLLCTTQYYNVLLCTTKYYASTTLYYASTTTYYSGTTLKRHLQCAAQQESPPNFTKYCACHAKWMSSMICVTYETSFPMRGASKVTLQPHQILRLPRKMNVVDDLRHIWNVISNARSQSSHPPTSPNTAPATKSWSSRFQRKLPECFRQ